MAQRVYATTSEYEDVAEESSELDDAALAKRLRAASSEVDGLTRLAIFDVDEDGYPTNPEIAEAFTEATCAIAEFWETTDDPTGGVEAAGVVKIGSVTLGSSASGQVKLTARDKLVARIGERAVTILGNAQLLNGDVAY